MGKEVPGCSMRTVVFANGAPGTLADIGPPVAPEELATRLNQSTTFGGIVGKRRVGRNPFRWRLFNWR